jgi:DNA-binding NarL/FixJ family response regulator
VFQIYKVEGENKMLKILYIDDKESEIKTYGRALKEAIDGDGIEVVFLYPPYENMEDFLDVLNDPDIASLIIDHKLQDKVTYSGIELAMYLRGVNTKLPIYILTNFDTLDDEFAGDEWSVEAIIAKDSLIPKLDTYKARILRRLNIFGDVLAEREERFHELLRKSLNAEITDEESKEIEELQFARTEGLLAKELPQLEELEKILRLYEEKMNILRKK